MITFPSCRPSRRVAALALGVALIAGASAQELAPAALADTVYLAIPTDQIAKDFPRDYPAKSAILSGDGTATPINFTTTPGVLPSGKYTWTKSTATAGVLIITTGSTSTRLEITFTGTNSGTYREVPSGSGNPVSGTITFAAMPADATPPLLNVSTRATLIPGQAAIGGFVVEGSGPKQVVIRAVGPSLAQFGVSNVAANPALTVFKGATQIGANSGWGGSPTLAAAFVSVGAFTLPSNSRDSAVVLTLDPGNYTAQARDSNGGEVLLEVYLVK